MKPPMKPQHDLDALKRDNDRPHDHIAHYIDPTVTFEDRASTRVWHYSVILADCKIGAWVSIGSGTEIGRGSVIGKRARIGSNCFLPSHTIVGESVFVGPGVTCTDDRHPRVPDPNEPPYDARPPILEDGCSIGAAAVLLPGVRIGKNARVGAGAIVAHDVAPNTMVRCDPARVYAVPAEWQSADGAE